MQRRALYIGGFGLATLALLFLVRLVEKNQLAEQALKQAQVAEVAAMAITNSFF